MARLRRLSSLLVAVVGAVAFPSRGVAYDTVPVSDGGTISGKVVFQGNVPTRKIIPTKDREVCGAIRDEPEVMVAPDHGVQDAIVYLKDVQKGKPLVKPPKSPEIVNDHCRFVPHVQAFPVGTVVIVNDDPILHNTHGFLANVTVFNQALPMKGMHIPKPLTKPGLVRIDCDVHGWMRGWIYAADNPYYAVTQKDGTFRLSDVPPGSYTVVAWQEYTGETDAPVTVKPKEAAQVTIELKKK
jgi:hypothetical protein